MTLDAQCGSSQQATSLAYAMVRAGVVEVALACGVESMSQVPMGSAIPPNAPSPLPAGYPTEWTSQFQGAELIAAKWGLTRAELDDFGLRTQARAAAAWSAGSFDTQIVPVGAAKRDEGLRETSAQALAGLKPIVGAGDPFVGPEPGRHTAATASQISDGAAAVLVMSAAKAETLGLTPLARIVDGCLVGSDPPSPRPVPSPQPSTCSPATVCTSPTSTGSRSTRPSPPSSWLGRSRSAPTPRRSTPMAERSLLVTH
jgi:acetyl-CoA C-acetyltransferase